MATIDAKLIALDAKTGQPVWQRDVADPAAGYAMTLAPLVVKDKVIVGVAGGEYGDPRLHRGVRCGHRQGGWRFYTIPGPGEPGHETWTDGGDAWQHGGASVWVTGSYDPELDLTYWGVGNPGPDWNPTQRPGDNLYSDSVVALDPEHRQAQVAFSIHAARSLRLRLRAGARCSSTCRRRDVTSGKLMLWGNRNGFFYVLDRVTGEFVRGNPFVKVNWASGLDERGRPIETPQPEGAVTFPGVQGGTNWYSPSYSPSTRAVLLSAWENYGSVFRPQDVEYQAGLQFVGGLPGSPLAGAANVPGLKRGPINNWTEALGNGAVIAIDPRTGAQRWRSAAHRRLERRNAYDSERRAVHGDARGILLRARRSQRQDPVAHELGRSGRERADLLRGRRRPVRRGRERQRSVRVRLAPLVRIAALRAATPAAFHPGCPRNAGAFAQGRA